MSRLTPNPETHIEDDFLNYAQDAESMEEIVWLQSVWTAIVEENWSNVPYRGWVLTEVGGSEYIRLLNKIDQLYGDEIGAAKEPSTEGRTKYHRLNTMPMQIEYNAETADELAELPEPGDTINYNGEEKIVKAVHVVNETKLLLTTYPKGETKRYEDPTDHSIEWEKLPERFLDND